MHKFKDWGQQRPSVSRARSWYYAELQEMKLWSPTVLVKLIPVQRAKAARQMLLLQPFYSPWGMLWAHRACWDCLTQPPAQGNAAAWIVSLKRHWFQGVLAECRRTSEPCRASFGLTPAAMDKLLGLCTAVVSLLLTAFPAWLIICFSALAHTEHYTGPHHVTRGSSCNPFELLGF